MNNKISKSEKLEFLFSTRDDFRAWLQEHSETHEGVWLVFGKTKAVITLTANDALEEALCFGWIDGQIKSIDDTKYLKYFARRPEKSQWSERNKKIAQKLRESGLMTSIGEEAIATAMKNGTWDTPRPAPVTDSDIDVLKEKLESFSPAYENFMKMSKSVQVTYTKRFLSFKTEEARLRDFEKIVIRLNNNLKPM